MVIEKGIWYHHLLEVGFSTTRGFVSSIRCTSLDIKHRWIEVACVSLTFWWMERSRWKSGSVLWNGKWWACGKLVMGQWEATTGLVYHIFFGTVCVSGGKWELKMVTKSMLLMQCITGCMLCSPERGTALCFEYVCWINMAVDCVSCQSNVVCLCI